LWVDPSPPHALRVPRLVPCRSLPPTAAPAVDPNGFYLITGGTGGVGGALIAWLLYEQNVPSHNIMVISRRDVQPPHAGVRCVKADLASAAALGRCSELCALRAVTGIFHLAGVLDDGLLVNMSRARLHMTVRPKAGVLELLEMCQTLHWCPRWLLVASSTSSLLGYAGQSNYCAANGLLDHMATFGLPTHLQQHANGGASPLPHVLTLNFGPWGEVGMAKEGTKAHQLSLQSGELPMASSAAISCIAEALRQLRAGAVTAEVSGQAGRPAGEPLGGNNLQFAVADVEWWRSPWPSHSLLQGVMRRLAPLEAETAEDDAAPADVDSTAVAEARAADVPRAGVPGCEVLEARVEDFLRSRLSVWHVALPLVELGLDSLDLVQLRTAFQKKFRVTVPMSTFTNAQQTLGELIDKLSKV
jgi:acyl carrier protein